MKVKFNNLFLQNKPILEDSKKIFVNTFKNSKFVFGSEIDKFEKNFSKILGSNYCVSVANGTDALIIALKCLGVKYGDEVITSAHTWVSTAGAIVAVGAKPIFVDTDKFFSIDPDKIEKKISRKTKAIIPVHLYGQSCDMDKIIKIAKKNNLKIIEDCAQAHLSKYKNKYLGNFGDVGTFSFFPAKNLGSIGDAGAIVCKKKNLYQLLKRYKNHGSIKKNIHETLGINSRMDSIHAAFLNKKIKYLKKFNSRRNKIAKIYYSKLKDNKNIELPNLRIKSKHTFHQYVIKVKKNRDRLIEYLTKKNIEVGIHYPKMVINLKPYKKNINKKEFKNCLKYENSILSLPIHPFLTYKEILFICKNINNFFKK